MSTASLLGYSSFSSEIMQRTATPGQVSAITYEAVRNVREVWVTLNFKTINILWLLFCAEVEKFMLEQLSTFPHKVFFWPARIPATLHFPNKVVSPVIANKSEWYRNCKTLKLFMGSDWQWWNGFPSPLARFVITHTNGWQKEPSDRSWRVSFEHFLYLSPPSVLSCTYCE